MLDYQTWTLQIALQEVNEIIDEVNMVLLETLNELETKLPAVKYLTVRNGVPGAQWFIDEEKKKNTPNPEKVGIRNCLIKAYKDEERIQREGIRFPPGVIVRKINHCVFNYDEVQDKISELVSSGELTCCDAVRLRMRLKDKMHQLSRRTLDMIKFPLKVGKDVEISGPETYDSLDRIYRKDMDQLKLQQNMPDCGDCGGGRSSERNKKSPYSGAGRRFNR